MYSYYGTVHLLDSGTVGTMDKKSGTTTYTRTDQLKGGTAQLEECTESGSTNGRHGVPTEMSPTCPMLGR
jgi:hypothetical protein